MRTPALSELCFRKPKRILRYYLMQKKIKKKTILDHKTSCIVDLLRPLVASIDVRFDGLS